MGEREDTPEVLNPTFVFKIKLTQKAEMTFPKSRDYLIARPLSCNPLLPKQVSEKFHKVKMGSRGR